MGSRIARIAIVCTTLAAVAAPGASASERPAGAERMIEAVNEVRAAHGLGPLAFSHTLARSSARYAAWQMRADWFGHLAQIRAAGRWAALGEAIAKHRGRRPFVHRTLRGWLRSPGHAALLLSPSFSQAGAAVSQGRFGRSRATIWVLQLGRPAQL